VDAAEKITSDSAADLAAARLRGLLQRARADVRDETSP
jgi:hypothetical protein